jgi:hypothetical protein
MSRLGEKDSKALDLIRRQPILGSPCIERHRGHLDLSLMLLPRRSNMQTDPTGWRRPLTWGFPARGNIKFGYRSRMCVKSVIKPSYRRSDDQTIRLSDDQITSLGSNRNRGCQTGPPDARTHSQNGLPLDTKMAL